MQVTEVLVGEGVFPEQVLYKLNFCKMSSMLQVEMQI